MPPGEYNSSPLYFSKDLFSTYVIDMSGILTASLHTSGVKWRDPGHFLKAQGKFIFSFPCALFLHIFDT